MGVCVCEEFGQGHILLFFFALQGTTKICRCQTDYCNSSRGTVIASLTLTFVGVLIAAMFFLWRCWFSRCQRPFSTTTSTSGILLLFKYGIRSVFRQINHRISHLFWKQFGKHISKLDYKTGTHVQSRFADSRQIFEIKMIRGFFCVTHCGALGRRDSNYLWSCRF